MKKVSEITPKKEPKVMRDLEGALESALEAFAEASISKGIACGRYDKRQLKEAFDEADEVHQQILDLFKQQQEESWEQGWALAHEPATCGHARANYKDPNYGTPEYTATTRCEACKLVMDAAGWELDCRGAEGAREHAERRMVEMAGAQRGLLIEAARRGLRRRWSLREPEATAEAERIADDILGFAGRSII